MPTQPEITTMSRHQCPEPSLLKRVAIGALVVAGAVQVAKWAVEAWGPVTSFLSKVATGVVHVIGSAIDWVGSALSTAAHTGADLVTTANAAAHAHPYAFAAVALGVGVYAGWKARGAHDEVELEEVGAGMEA